MEPKAYIESGFFEAFKNFVKLENEFEIDSASEIRNSLITILKNSYIYTSQKDNISEYIKDDINTYSSQKEYEKYFLKSALRANKLRLDPIDYSHSNTVFFLEKSSEECTEISIQYGIKALGKDFNFNEKIFANSFAHKPCNEKMEGHGLNLLEHSCKNVIYIDPYFFKDAKKKIHNFCKLIDKLFLNANQTSHISIIAQQDKTGSNNEYYTKIISSIQEHLINKNNTISIYLHGNNKFDSNRHLITDYCLADLQHILDRNGTISADFFYSHEISENFKIVNSLLKKIKTAYNNDPEKNGLYIMKFGNILENSLLK